MIRKAEKKPKFRTGKQSLKARVDKKLTEKENWFRKKKLSEDAENIENSEKKEKKGSSWKHYRCKKPRISALEEVSKEESPAKAVLFVQNTAGSELAGQIRQLVNELKPWTGIGLKIVERAGNKIQDLLHKSNPWDNQSCERKGCPT